MTMTKSGDGKMLVVTFGNEPRMRWHKNIEYVYSGAPIVDPCYTVTRTGYGDWIVKNKDESIRQNFRTLKQAKAFCENNARGEL